MRVEHDREADAVHVNVTDRSHARTIEVKPLNVYVDAESRTLGIEFPSLNAFQRYIEEHGGLDVPEKFTGPQSPAPA